MTTDLILIDEKSIKDKIYYIRGKKVMIDSDLAEIYGYATKDFNRQVKNNIDRFDDDFRFQLTDEEIAYLSRCKNSTTMQVKGTKGGRVYNPYAFTEEGIYMLMTVLKGEKAIKQSKALIRIFKSMKDYLVENKILEQKYINNMVLEHDSSIKLLKESFEKNKKTNEIYFNGQQFDAYSKIINILTEAKDRLIIIDSYADIVLLNIIKELSIDVLLITTNKHMKKDIIDIYNEQYSNLKVIYDDTFHDRYFVVDNTVYHCGASINRIGYKTFSINLISDEEVCTLLINKIINLINNI